MPERKKAGKLDDLVSVFHESLWTGNAGWLDSLPAIGEPLKKWLTAHVESLKIADRILRSESS